MEVLIITLLIANVVVVVGAGVVVAGEVKKLNEKVDAEVATLRTRIDKNQADSRLTRATIITEIKTAKNALMVSDASTRDTIKQNIKGELHNEIIKLAFTPL
jgi:hypothetical protein